MAGNATRPTVWNSSAGTCITRHASAHTPSVPSPATAPTATFTSCSRATAAIEPAWSITPNPTSGRTSGQDQRGATGPSGPARSSVAVPAAERSTTPSASPHTPSPAATIAIAAP